MPEAPTLTSPQASLPSSSSPPVTPEALAVMSGGGDFELLDGELVEKTMSFESEWVAGRVMRFVGNFAEDSGMGLVCQHVQCRCFPDDPNRVRIPDAAYFKRGRLPGDRPPRSGFATVPPDLAVEVVSPHDRYEEVNTKIRQYLDAGIPLIWVIDPLSRSAMVYHGGLTFRLTEDGDLDGLDVIPGFRRPLRDVLPTEAAD